MQDWPEELNVSKFDEGYKGEEAEEEADAKTNEHKDNAASKDDEPRHPNKQ